jgi:predicted nuclease of predicted toxin-antitoxin system
LAQSNLEEKLFASLYFDEDVSAIVARILRNRGFDVACAHEVGMLGAKDQMQLAYAVERRRTFVTHNKKHFIQWHNRYVNLGQRHYGIIIATRRRNNYEVARRLLQLLDSVTANELEMELRYV